MEEINPTCEGNDQPTNMIGILTYFLYNSRIRSKILLDLSYKLTRLVMIKSISYEA